MRILSLSLEKFRSYKHEDIKLSDAFCNVLVGPNGIGKTNVLEALALLSITKSPQGLEEADLVRWGEEFYRVSTRIISDTEEEMNLELFSQMSPRKQKACFVNDVRVPISRFVGKLPLVSFLPQDLDLFTGSPARRRAFFDNLLCQVSPEYMQTLSQYQKLVKQRNSLLKKIKDGEAKEQDLSVWDLEVAQKGALITLRRLEIIEVLQCTLLEELHSLGEEWEKARIVYNRKGEASDLNSLEKELIDLLMHYRQRDIILQSTTVGPHREDWYLEIDGKNLTSFASRGQQRVCVLALLFLQVSYLELQRNEKPVILLDDVFSELDDAHQSALLSSLKSYQVFITATHIPPGLGEARLLEVTSGVVRMLEAGVKR
jgi:DNA replication and repair protein RecF